MHCPCVPNEAIAITVTNQVEYGKVIQRYTDAGYRFTPCDDLRRLFHGAIGLLNHDRPVVWVRLPILEIVEDDEDESARDGHDGVRARLFVDEPIVERFVGLDIYLEEFDRHKTNGHDLIEATDPLCYRLAFVCATCQEIVRADWDECIALACVLERSVDEAENKTVSFLEG